MNHVQQHQPNYKTKCDLRKKHPPKTNKQKTPDLHLYAVTIIVSQYEELHCACCHRKLLATQLKRHLAKNIFNNQQNGKWQWVCLHAVVISLGMAETQLLQILSSRRHNLFKLITAVFICSYVQISWCRYKQRLKSQPVLTNLSEEA